ncbi:MAG: hypothetical protein HUJ25_03285 [Crocinitomicaceae bacterium]|nr:hypothetical protein [Crocinitomicaceae bacterium]
MKKVLLIWMLLALHPAWSQNEQEEVFSFYFDEAAVFVLNSVKVINPRLYGKYELSDTPQNELRRAAGEFLVVDETGVYLEKNRLLSISREEVRENSQYRVSKGWLHGVVENDSVPCALDGDSYFFLVPAKTYLYGRSGGRPERLVQISGSSYALFNQADNGHFSAIIVNFIQNGVQLKDIVFSTKEPNDINQIEKKKKKEVEGNDFITYILSPTKEEWDSFVFKNCLETYDSYSLVKE